MGKNINGGNHKHTKRVSGQHRLRTSTCDDEVYAIIIKMLGNGMCHVKCNDDVTRLCIIRGGFSGKHKSGNIVKISSWVLVGIREWETTLDGKLPKCDLLEIYSEGDKEQLISWYSSESKILSRTPQLKWMIYISEKILISILMQYKFIML